MDTEKFEFRKQDHIRESFNVANQAGVSPSSQVRLFHRALPELDFEEVDLKTEIFGRILCHDNIDRQLVESKPIQVATPIFISSMTAGHKEGEKINSTLFEACSQKNWLLGVGSQRKELVDSKAQKEWKSLRQSFPEAKILGNIGLSQLIEFGAHKVLDLIESLKPVAFGVHLNPLQELIQDEGTPQFKGGLKALSELCRLSPVPIVLKETGCGFCLQDFLALKEIEGLYAVDVAGYGGTHWGRIEGHRSHDEILQKAALTYAQWGQTTAESINYFHEVFKADSSLKLWASGGVRNGLDVVTCLSMGCEMVGLAQPFMKAASEGLPALKKLMTSLEFETKVGLFCTGHKSPYDCQKNGVWEWKKG